MIGGDVDTRPSDVSFGISRKVGVITPAFEDGKTLPLLSASSLEHAGFPGLRTHGSFTFAGGAAAIAVADGSDKGNKRPSPEERHRESLLRVSATPTNSSRHQLSKPGEAKRFTFASDSTYGIRMTGAAGFPQEANAGAKNKEFAWAPVGYTIDSSNTFLVGIPSFIATRDEKQTSPLGVFAVGAASSVRTSRFLATGHAATALGERRALSIGLLVRPEFKNSLWKGLGDVSTPWLMQQLGAQPEIHQLDQLSHWLKQNGFNISTDEFLNSPTETDARLKYSEYLRKIQETWQPNN